jgi:hypothetical protein
VKLQLRKSLAASDAKAVHIAGYPLNKNWSCQANVNNVTHQCSIAAAAAPGLVETPSTRQYLAMAEYSW